jgi:hypothetical protein
MDLRLDCIASYAMPVRPPWLLQPAEFIYSIHDVGKKSDTAPTVFQSRLIEISSAFDGYRRIFMDGSKEAMAVAAAAVWCLCLRKTPAGQFMDLHCKGSANPDCNGRSSAVSS